MAIETEFRTIDDCRSEMTGICTVTGEKYAVVFDTVDYVDWKSGCGYIQDLMSYLSDDEREFLMSGFTPAEWNEMFGDEGEDDED